MIFVTVGTTQYPFDRLLKVIDKCIETGEIKETVFAQTGSSRYVPKCFKSCDFMPFDKMVESVQEANLVVTHDGVGSALLCLSLGKIPILFPRRPRLGEVVYDTHIEFARRMEKQGSLLVAYDEQDLIDKINNYQKLVAQLSTSDHSLGKKDLLQYLDSILQS